MSFGPSAKTPPRHLGPAPRRGWAADSAAEPQIRVEPRRTSTGDDLSPPASPITGGWFRSRLSGDGSPPKSPDTRPESPFSLGGLAARAGDALRADNEALFRQGLFNAVGNAILLLLVGLLYAVSSLLSQYRAPILWAVLVSLALRDVKVALVRFWADQLTRHTLAGVALAPARPRRRPAAPRGACPPPPPPPRTRRPRARRPPRANRRLTRTGVRTRTCDRPNEG